MYYAIISEDIADSLPLRQSARPAHIGSLVIAEFDSLEDAQAWADADPYIEAGVYAQVVVKPYKIVLP